MDDLKMEMSLNNEDVDEIVEFLQKQDLSYIKSKRRGFDGNGIIVLLISGGVLNMVVDALAKIIISVIERKEPRSFKINDIEITGYSVEQIKELLDHAYEKNII